MRASLTVILILVCVAVAMVAVAYEYDIDMDAQDQLKRRPPPRMYLTCPSFSFLLISLLTCFLLLCFFCMYRRSYLLVYFQTGASSIVISNITNLSMVYRTSNLKFWTNLYCIKMQTIHQSAPSTVVKFTLNIMAIILITVLLFSEVHRYNSTT